MALDVKLFESWLFGRMMQGALNYISLLVLVRLTCYFDRTI